MDHTYSQTLTLRRILLVIATGVGAGFLSGLFGVGGGLVIVPALMAVLGMDQRRASSTSLAAIIVTAAVGSGTYALHSEVSWAGAALLVVGALAGVLVGACVLPLVGDAPALAALASPGRSVPLAALTVALLVGAGVVGTRLALARVSRGAQGNKLAPI